MPPAAIGGFFNGGKNIVPRAVITSPDGLQYWRYASYQDLKDKSTYRDISSLVKDNLSNNGEIRTAGTKDTVFQQWRTRSDTVQKGDFVAIAGKRLKIKGDKGERSVNLNSLIKSDVEWAKIYANKGGEANDETGDTPSSDTTVELGYEEWSSADGLKIQAKFVSLKNGQLTILKEGQTAPFTIPLSRLAQGSRDRANELAK